MNKLENCWPTEQQQLLLQAGCLPPSAALTSWEQWRQQVDIQNLDSVSNSLLSLVYYNLKDSAPESPDFSTCKSTYRRSWFNVNLLFRNVSDILDKFKEEKIAAVLLKGIAQSIYYYQDFGARPMADIDVLVSVENAIPAINLLLENGWHLVHFDASEITDEILQTRHAVELRKGDNVSLDLHWYLLPELCGRADIGSFISRSITVEYQNKSYLLLNPADQLLHVIIHGIKYNPVSSIRWIPDAVAVINKTAMGFDWNDLLKRAQHYRSMWPLSQAIRFLAEYYVIQIPAEILAIFQNYKPRAVERRFMQLIQSRQAWNPVLALWLQNTAQQNYASLPKRLWTFPGFLKTYWQLKSAWQLPFMAAHRMWRYLTRKSTRPIED